MSSSRFPNTNSGSDVRPLKTRKTSLERLQEARERRSALLSSSDATKRPAPSVRHDPAIDKKRDRPGEDKATLIAEGLIRGDAAEEKQNFLGPKLDSADQHGELNRVLVDQQSSSSANLANRPAGRRFAGYAGGIILIFTIPLFLGTVFFAWSNLNKFREFEI